MFYLLVTFLNYSKKNPFSEHRSSFHSIAMDTYYFCLKELSFNKLNCSFQLGDRTA